jgi:hypothetical protein
MGQTPTNDCDSAPTVGGGTYFFDTSGMTPNHWGLGTCGVSSNSPDVWLKVVSGMSGNMTVETCGLAFFDTVLAAFDGCGGNQLACNDDACSLQSRITFPVTAGVPVVIRISGYNGASGSGSVNIIEPQPPPPGTFEEIGDAGELPGTAMVVAGSGPLNAIRGNNTGSDVDMYLFEMCDPGQFSATTVGGATWDTQLFLFDSQGRGISHNDDSSSTLQSTLTNLYTWNLPAGRYLLAISGYNRDPLNAAGQLIWNNTPFGVERQPDGPGAIAGDITVAFWTGTSGSGVYQINLTGACFVSTCPGTGSGACSRADWNEDGTVDFNDFLAFLNDFNAEDPCADLNQDGTVDFNDFLEFLNIYNVGC